MTDKMITPITIAKFGENTFGMMEGIPKGGELCRDGILGTRVLYLTQDVLDKVKKTTEPEIHTVLGELFNKQ